jgi:folate-binding protein YgfZ
LNKIAGIKQPMNTLSLHEFHARLSGRFGRLNESEVVEDYGDPLAEHAALRETAGIVDLSFRSRLCLTGADRQKFLNGQVTNNVKDLKMGEGCYAALINAKGKMQSDLNIFILTTEILLDFEPGLAERVTQRLDKYVIADDVQIVDIAPQYGLLSIQGPKAESVSRQLGLNLELPLKPMTFHSVTDATLGEIYLVNHSRTGSDGFDLYAPTAAMAGMTEKAVAVARNLGGRPCGWQAFEIARIEAGIPRFGADMDETNLPPEAGIDARAISYTKGCYIGQEVIARIRTYGQVAKALRGLRLADNIKDLPRKGDKLYRGDKEIGYVTSAIASPALKSNIALAFVRREANQIGTELIIRTTAGESTAKIVQLPFTVPG